MPLLIVNIWVLSLLFLSLLASERMDGGVAEVLKASAVALFAAWVVLSLLIVVVRFLNWPKFVIPPYARGSDGPPRRPC